VGVGVQGELFPDLGRHGVDLVDQGWSAQPAVRG
jgi:hypothetical protein